ncbi:hypothetical protein TSOC_007457 [Tetrabaena socialis]|uniref:D-xylose 1-dehydrogenase (NADP(+), D-xylono-1,5-lactone-forming) n=1 Tax=Tetrabaena socialis TaxID=47790 RepID=A0A2J8A0Z5_9CHLO|nr:hypothetical protein TSOC_007457 [Tetrabaena socialis]|eukprot:PNH06190.1 hypothetical protein TSOC_007457 [Tetrabaena socialis]
MAPMPVFLDVGQLSRITNFIGLGGQPKAQQPVRIGVLGASQVATYAMLWPARRVPQAEVVAVAARDGIRARKYAKQHGIPRSWGSYEALLADPEVDAVYVGLPNGLHGQWATAALRAGKHVLCEKPFAANEQEASTIAPAPQPVALEQAMGPSEAAGALHGDFSTSHQRPPQAWLDPDCLAAAVAFMEAHPGNMFGSHGPTLAALEAHSAPQLPLMRPHQLVAAVEGLAALAHCPGRAWRRAALAAVGGVVARLSVAEVGRLLQVVDAAMSGSLRWLAPAPPAGSAAAPPAASPDVRATFRASLQHEGLMPISTIDVVGDRGRLHCSNFIMPVFGHVLRLTTTAPAAEAAGGSGAAAPAPGANPAAPAAAAATTTTVMRVYGSGESTYHYQLSRFVRDVRAVQAAGARGEAAEQQEEAGADAGALFASATRLRPPTLLAGLLAEDEADAVANMALVDAVYRAAGLAPRLPSAQALEQQKQQKQREQLEQAARLAVAEQRRLADG